MGVVILGIESFNTGIAFDTVSILGSIEVSSILVLVSNITSINKAHQSALKICQCEKAFKITFWSLTQLTQRNDVKANLSAFLGLVLIEEDKSSSKNWQNFGLFSNL